MSATAQQPAPIKTTAVAVVAVQPPPAAKDLQASASVTTAAIVVTDSKRTDLKDTVHEEKLVLSEEQLVVSKQEELVGSLDVEKTVTRTTAQVPVILEREVVSIERRPLAAGSQSIGVNSQAVADFGKPLRVVEQTYVDQAIASKIIVPTEQLTVQKLRVAEDKVVQGSVRTENLDVKRDVSNVDAVKWTGAEATTTTEPVHSDNIIGADGRVVAFEERLAVGKQRVASGQVEVKKRVDTVTASAPVRLEHDVLAVQRGAISSAPPPTAFTEGRAHIDVTKETVQVSKVIVPKEEVVIRKSVQAETHLVEGELLHESIAVHTEGDVHVTAAAATATTAVTKAAITTSTTTTTTTVALDAKPAGDEEKKDEHDEHDEHEDEEHEEQHTDDKRTDAHGKKKHGKKHGKRKH